MHPNYEKYPKTRYVNAISYFPHNIIVPGLHDCDLIVHAFDWTRIGMRSPRCLVTQYSAIMNILSSFLAQTMYTKLARCYVHLFSTTSFV